MNSVARSSVTIVTRRRALLLNRRST